MTDNRYYELKLSTDDAHFILASLEERISLQSAKWYRHPITENHWISIPEINPHCNRHGYFFSPKTTLTLIDND